ncbi:hypothetical protein CEN48_14555 [Fischerella thermalis CCMEE 5282]|nr:hypothetical protein CI593_06150 [Fischerella thermalis CCMEE 5194]PMB04157.1 hypothetical protein CI592_13735 [Fischerella thermalis CCMEE 5328]PMB13312.1 hypothetical protein CEN48_14555 [Fischerella thermalis CCMEE 5282]PMB35643.1 hypothetical protein CEN43_04610 [Fischerella thermalis BR2B]
MFSAFLWLNKLLLNHRGTELAERKKVLVLKLGNKNKTKTKYHDTINSSLLKNLATLTLLLLVLPINAGIVLVLLLLGNQQKAIAIVDVLNILGNASATENPKPRKER